VTASRVGGAWVARADLAQAELAPEVELARAGWAREELEMGDSETGDLGKAGSERKEDSGTATESVMVGLEMADWGRLEVSGTMADWGMTVDSGTATESEMRVGLARTAGSATTVEWEMMADLEMREESEMVEWEMADSGTALRQRHGYPHE
jgi:hypothetical protein